MSQDRQESTARGRAWTPRRKRFLVGSLAVLALLFTVLSFVLHPWLQQRTRQELALVLPRQLKELYQEAERSVAAGDRYTAYLLFKVLRPLRGKLFRANGDADSKLFLTMRDEDCRYSTRAHDRAAEALRRAGEPTVSLWLLMLNDRRIDPGARAVLVRVLYRVAPNRLRAALLELAKRSYFHKGRAALWEASIYLGYLGGDETNEALIRLVELMKNWGRQYPIISLKNLNAVEAAPAIEKALKDPCIAVRRHAARALEVLGQRRSIKPLREMLSHETDSLARRFALSALRRLQRPDLP